LKIIEICSQKVTAVYIYCTIYNPNFFRIFVEYLFIINFRLLDYNISFKILTWVTSFNILLSGFFSEKLEFASYRQIFQRFLIPFVFDLNLIRPCSVFLTKFLIKKIFYREKRSLCLVKLQRLFSCSKLRKGTRQMHAVWISWVKN